jgi:hypothetical protein
MFYVEPYLTPATRELASEVTAASTKIDHVPSATRGDFVRIVRAASVVHFAITALAMAHHW